MKGALAPFSVKGGSMLKLHIKNKNEVEHFPLEFNNLTHDIYFENFGRDLVIEVLESIAREGFFTRAVAHRVVWAMAKTHNENFVDFREFLLSLEDDILDFESTWGRELFQYLEPYLKDLIDFQNKEKIEDEE